MNINCQNCGADLAFDAGTSSLKCVYCDTVNEIEIEKAEIVEKPIEEFIQESMSEHTAHKVQNVNCTGCGADVTLEPGLQSSSCPYCATPIVAERAKEVKALRPDYVLPFKVTSNEAIRHFSTWLREPGKAENIELREKIFESIATFFMPSELRKGSLNLDTMKSVYLSFWTFDAQTTTDYVGQRGTRVKSGKKSKLKWSSPFNGQVSNTFDDVLIEATTDLDNQKLRDLEPWDLDQLEGYNKSFLQGHQTQKYQVSLKQGLEVAKVRMDETIDETIRRDIGGSQQRINSKSVKYDGVTFKYILLPVYINAFRYKDKVYQFIINARTGEVKGEKPEDALKVGIAIVLGAILLGTFLYFKFIA